MLLGDFNTHLGWGCSEEGETIPLARGSKPQTLQNLCMAKRLRLLPQTNPDVPSFVSRKPDTRSTQIDAAFSTCPHMQGTTVLKDSRLSISSDHEAIRIMFQDLEGERARKDRRGHGPRMVTQNFSLPAVLDQDSLQDLARLHTRVRQRPRFHMSSATRQLGLAARVNQTAQAWKNYQRAVQQEHAAWQKDVAERACRDWDAFRFHHHARKSQNTWATGLAKKHTSDPFLAVVCHFTDTFHVEAREDDAAVLQRLIETIHGTSPRLTDEEVAQAVRESKNHKTPGADKVPVELLKYIVQQPGGTPKLTRCYQDVLDRNIFPPEWAQVAVKLLGKTASPEQPGDLRPIAVHSQVAKVLGRILLGRVRGRFAPRLPGQTAAKGRQPGDYVWTMQRVCQLAYEWGVPLAAIKIDLAKAFDLISRSRLGHMIVQRLAEDHPQECRCLLTILLPSEITIATPWADFTTHSNSNVGLPPTRITAVGTLPECPQMPTLGLGRHCRTKGLHQREPSRSAPE